MIPPKFTAIDILAAESVCSFLSENLAIQFKLEGDSFTRDQMQAHVDKRAALHAVQMILLDEASRLNEIESKKS